MDSKNILRQGILHNPDLPKNNKFPGNRISSNVFKDQYQRKHPSQKDFIKHGLSRNPQKKEKRNENFSIGVIPNSALFNKEENAIVWLGHSSFLICLNNTNLLIDPVFFDLPFYKRHVGLPCTIDQFINIDYILISHSHRDHCDLRTIKMLVQNNPNVKILTGLKMKKVFRNPLKKRVQEAGWHQQYITNNRIKISFLPAIHWSRRYFFDINRTLWGSFMIEDSKTKIYFAGDTAYGTHFKEITEMYDSPDYAILPIGTYKPEYIMKCSHIDPTEAFEAFRDLGSDHFIPMHYGTYDLSNEPMGEPLKRIQTLFNDHLSNHQLKVLNVGEKLLCPKKIKSC